MTTRRVAVLVSGSGRHLRNLLERSAAGTLRATIDLVIASRAGIGALDHARAFDVVSRVVEPRDVTAALDAAGVDYVVMAGYLKLWDIPDRWIGRTLNIHPSLLPLFGGRGFFGHHVHEAVLKSGMRISGCTVHLVTRNYDEGPILVQRACPVHDNDSPETLAARVFTEELVALPDALTLLMEKTPRIDGRRVRFDT